MAAFAAEPVIAASASAGCPMAALLLEVDGRAGLEVGPDGPCGSGGVWAEWDGDEMVNVSIFPPGGWIRGESCAAIGASAELAGKGTTGPGCRGDD